MKQRRARYFKVQGIIYPPAHPFAGHNCVLSACFLTRPYPAAPNLVTVWLLRPPASTQLSLQHEAVPQSWEPHEAAFRGQVEYIARLAASRPEFCSKLDEFERWQELKFGKVHSFRVLQLAFLLQSQQFWR
mmetsp:Transcript_28962/g.59341  ORF Transcript_28962/g.59341 Transcript_28962/m.59341 type:complete len:131 (-) Transcript_28962:53-445(-)